MSNNFDINFFVDGGKSFFIYFILEVVKRYLKADIFIDFVLPELKCFCEWVKSHSSQGDCDSGKLVKCFIFFLFFQDFGSQFRDGVTGIFYESFEFFFSYKIHKNFFYFYRTKAVGLNQDKAGLKFVKIGF